MPLKKVLQKSLRMLSWIIRSVFALHSEWKRTLFGKAQKVAHLCWFLSIHPLFSPFYFVSLHLLLKVCDFMGQAWLVLGSTWHIWGSPRKWMLEHRQHGAWNKATSLQKPNNWYGIKPVVGSAYLTWTKEDTLDNESVSPKKHMPSCVNSSTWMQYWCCSLLDCIHPCPNFCQVSQISPPCTLLKPCFMGSMASSFLLPLRLLPLRLPSGIHKIS